MGDVSDITHVRVKRIRLCCGEISSRGVEFWNIFQAKFKIENTFRIHLFFLFLLMYSRSKKKEKQKEHPYLF